MSAYQQGMRRGPALCQMLNYDACDEVHVAGRVRDDSTGSLRARTELQSLKCWLPASIHSLTKGFVFGLDIMHRFVLNVPEHLVPSVGSYLMVAPHMFRMAQ